MHVHMRTAHGHAQGHEGTTRGWTGLVSRAFPPSGSLGMAHLEPQLEGRAAEQHALRLQAQPMVSGVDGRRWLRGPRLLLLLLLLLREGCLSIDGARCGGRGKGGRGKHTCVKGAATC